MAKFRDMDRYARIIFVFSILDIVEAVLLVALGALAIGLGVGEESQDLFNGSLVMIVTGVITLLTGLLGIRAAKNPAKIKPVYILSIIGLVASVIALVVKIATGGEDILSAVSSVATSALMFFAAWNINKRV